jgi:hypothetical protein
MFKLFINLPWSLSCQSFHAVLPIFSCNRSSIRYFVGWSVRLSVGLSVGRFVCLSVPLSVCPFTTSFKECFKLFSQQPMNGFWWKLKLWLRGPISETRKRACIYKWRFLSNPWTDLRLRLRGTILTASRSVYVHTCMTSKRAHS